MAKMNFKSILCLVALGEILHKASPQEVQSVIDPDRLPELQETVGPDTYTEWTGWKEWVPAPDVVEAFPYYKMGYDYDGLAGRHCWLPKMFCNLCNFQPSLSYLHSLVYVTEFGKWNYRHWPTARVDEFWKYHEQLIRLHEKDAKMSGGQGTVCIMDWDGFQLKHHASQTGGLVFL